MVGDPESVFLYSGSREVFDAHRVTLADLGDPRYLGADPSLAVLYNTALLGLMYTTMNGFLHASALVGTAHADPAEFADLAVNWFLTDVVAPMVFQQVPNLRSGSYPGDVGTMLMNRNALDHIARTSIEQGIHSEQPTFNRDLADRAIAAGRGEENYFAIYEIFKQATV
ncbi:hypothetical protein [Nocardia sp. NPDC051570]|uniref:imine reductase family protein n=1 Tax=Nocardia sp. NPDC051570 TaxID=3364324 RepID=UPI00379938E3